MFDLNKQNVGGADVYGLVPDDDIHLNGWFSDYILVRGGWFRRLLWKWSFTCPTVIARNDVSVKVFEKYIRRSMGSMKFQYTRRDPGRKYLIFARNKSYLNVRGTLCEKRIHLLKNERVL